MDACNAEIASVTLCSLEKQLTLLTALMTTTLLVVIVIFAAGGYKSLQQKRKRVLLSINSPTQESNKDRGEMVLHNSRASCHAVQPGISYFSNELVKYCINCTTIMPVQRVSVDKGELVVS